MSEARETRAFAYAVLRILPCLERGERINVGVILYCRQFDFLGLEVSIDREKLAAVSPSTTIEPVAKQLEEIRLVIEGDPRGGALSRLDPSDRFGWLVAPSSTIIQASEVHTGLTEDPHAELRRLFKTLVL